MSCCHQESNSEKTTPAIEIQLELGPYLSI
jgi:hypothetical protein